MNDAALHAHITSEKNDTISGFVEPHRKLVVSGEFACETPSITRQGKRIRKNPKVYTNLCRICSPNCPYRHPPYT